MVIFGADLSSYQAGINVGQLVNEGFEFIIVKATEGDSYTNPYFTAHVNAARNAGALVGAYHFLRAGDGVAQARYFLSRVHQIGGPDGVLLFAGDCESDAGWETTAIFFAEWQRLTRRPAQFVYSGNWWWGPRGWNGPSFAPYLWDSRYVSGTDYASRLYEKVPDYWWQPRSGGWQETTILQFTSTARAAGYSIDANAFRGTREDLQQLISGETKLMTTAEISTRDKIDIAAMVAFGDSTTLGYTAGVDPSDSDGERVVQYSNKAIETRLSSKLDAIASKPAGTYVLTPEDRAAIVTDLVADIAPMLAEARQAVELLRRMMNALGAAGDAQGALNDE